MHEDNAVRARLIGAARAEFLRRYEERVFPGLGHGQMLLRDPARLAGMIAEVLG